MGDEEIVNSTGPVISPETVMAQSFTSAFRGYHPVEVREFLKRVGDELAAGAAREVELRRALHEALTRAAHPELDEVALTSLLGEHAAKLIASARDTAASIAAEAQKQAEIVVRQAEARERRMLDEADGVLARRVAEADKAADSIRRAAEAEVKKIGDAAAAEAESLIESATRQGKEMVAEARAVRERMLGDLARRRRTAQVQVEQLLAARDRLLAAYDVVRRTVDEATAELDAAEPEARTAAEAVARRAEEPGTAPRPDRGPEPWPPPASAPPAARPRPLGVSLAPAEREAPAPGSTLLRPPRRPQTVAAAVAGRAPSAAPPPPAPRPAPEPATAPAPASELATGEVPIVTPDGPPPVPETPASPASNVEALFARIRADEEQAEDAPSAAPEPAPVAVDPPSIDPVAGEQALEGRDELLDNLEAGLTRALKRVLQDEQNEVLDGLRRLGTASPPAIMPSADAQLAAYRDAALPWLQQAARAGIGFVSDPGSGPDAGKDHPAVDAQARALAVELVEPLRERLARAVGGDGETDDAEVIGERLRAVYRQWKVQHVEECARHAALTAFSVGAFEATPPVATLQWLVDDDGHCPDCDDNALAGPTTKGQPFPTGQLHPPAHPGCRCLLVAVGA